ncbi:uncharacterized protein LOC130711028 [Lotus japonicus]|uniref:uncharacterized protein LOC130711028 n=1 Tax=Lotus japonicus TaxID=34305 RepID=UPI00258C7A3E|nr:uncharacterized protein LOC130711028 [Lotus japonicus]
MAPAPPPPPPPNLSLWSILSESKRIINAHSRHFLALSVVFLLPISFSLVISPLLPTPSPTSQIHILLRQSQSQSQTLTLTPLPQSPFNLPLSPLLLLLLLILFSLSATATITHSVFHGFFGRPVKLLSTVTSLFSSSFTPLLATSIISHSILLSLPILILLLNYLTSPFSSSSHITLTASAFLTLALLSFTIYLRISWILAPVIAVVESSWGLEPLRRSAALMKGMKGVGAASFLFFSVAQGIVLWTGSLLTVDSGAWRDWAFVLQIVLASTVLMLLMLYSTAANTVLYMYCKAVHGELASEIAEEFAWQYVCLPFDDGKVPHVVSVLHV